MIKPLSEEQRTIDCLTEERNDPKFCSDYFIPIGDLRVADPKAFDKSSREKLTYKGSKAIAEG